MSLSDSADQADDKQQSAEEKVAGLHQACELFGQETARTESAYYLLKEEFQAVNLELEHANKDLQNKVSELDGLSSYLHSLIHNMKQGLLFIDLSGIVRTYNPAAETILEVAAQRVLARPFWEQFSDALFGVSIREVLAIRSLPNAAFIQRSIVANGKREVEVEMTFVNPEELIQNKGTEVSPPVTQGLIVLIRDITEMLKLQQIANRNDRLKELGEMAARMAHEIRNPLGGVKGFALLLERDLSNQPELKQMAAYIIEGTEIINRLVSNVLDYARPLQLVRFPVEVERFFKELKQHFTAHQNLDERIHIILDLAKGIDLFLIDEQRFRLAMLNLMLNAVQAMPEGGTLTLSAYEQEYELVIRVADTGVGIVPEDREKLFLPFFTTKPDGNGFGLAEVHKIVQAHGGSIDVDSRQRKGTAFVIRLPKESKG